MLSHPLWSSPAPGALGSAPQDIPTLTAYLPSPKKRNGATMLVLPGGGYGELAAHEGQGYAEWFAAHGVAAYVLQYRLGSHGYRHPVMLNDVARALRTVRSWALRDGLDPARIGIIGSSAGGHLASTLLTHFDAGNVSASDVIERESSRPDLGILCYPVISLGEFTHQGSKQNLLGENPPPDLVRLLSNELHVTAATPPTFLWHTADDTAVPVENALLFASALRRAGVPFDLHVYEHGRHGLGLPNPKETVPPWDIDLLFWLKQRRFL
ncbi:MAG: alpha/beta hydrolase [Opitutaceae bacterium]|nr:alpha/beta hydrolase [Opitutaceae bacterium]